MLAENQSVFFMMKRFPGNPLYGWFLGILAGSFILLAARMFVEKTWRKALPALLVLILTGFMAARSVRAIAMFGFVVIPVAAECAGVLIAATGSRVKKILLRSVTVLAISLVFFASAFPASYLSPVKRHAHYVEDKKYADSLFSILARPEIWGGLKPGVERSAEFFKSTGLKGPVFNNYDIGGYFIYHLFPQERPFVDNRPEAYPASFFKDIYGPMQADEKRWNEQLAKYGFQVIYFYRHDMTPDAQPFLIRRVRDPQWAPVFVDDYTIIFARRGGVNQPVIARHELPNAMFIETKN
jgi:hypothetical protein